MLKTVAGGAVFVCLVMRRGWLLIWTLLGPLNLRRAEGSLVVAKTEEQFDQYSIREILFGLEQSRTGLVVYCGC